MLADIKDAYNSDDIKFQWESMVEVIQDDSFGNYIDTSFVCSDDVLDTVIRELDIDFYYEDKYW